MTSSSPFLNRRRFLTATTGTGLTVVASSAVRSTAANSTIELGLIGCGGRGSWIANLFHVNGNARIVAAHDYFQRANQKLEARLKLPPDGPKWKLS